jgi:predicted CXXCH cytochrome family protein
VQNKAVLYLIAVIMFAGMLLLGAGLGNSIAINNLSHPHQALDCRNCHSFRSQNDSDSGDTGKPRATSRCLECHTISMSSDKTVSPFHELGDDCADCHSFHQPKLLTINGDTTTIALARSQSQLCVDCHKSTDLPEVSAGHREAARLLHGVHAELFTDSPSGFCLACHDVSSTLAMKSAGLAPPRLHLSASHPYDIKLIPGYQFSGSGKKLQNEIDPSIRFSDGNITCISCHSLTSGNQRLLVISTEDGLCTGCHDMQRSSAPQPFTQNE